MSRRLASAFAILALGLLLGSPAETRQSAPAPSPWTGAPGILRSVSEIMAAQAASESAPPRSKPLRLRPDRSKLRTAPGAPAMAQWPPQNPAAQKSFAVPMTPQTIGVNFLGAQISESGFIPPDSMGAVGPTQFLVVVNGRIKVFDKAGVLGPLNATLNAFFGSVLPAALDTSDPRVRFDRLSGRWFLSCITVDLDPTHPIQPPNRILLAMSDGPVISSASSFSFFFFQQDLVGTTPNSDTNGFADYDTLGIDANALYVGANMFNGAGNKFLGSTGWVIRKSSLIGGGPIVVTAFRQLCGSASAGPETPQGTDNDDPAATEGYFIGVDHLLFAKLQVRRISDPGGSPTISGNLSVTVPTTSTPSTVPALGSTQDLDGSNDRLMMAQIRNGSLWTVHNIMVDSSGLATGAGGTSGRNGARWYEIINLATTPTMNQSGTLFDPTVVTTGTARHIWMPSLAVSGQGHMALGHSIAAPTNSAGTQIQPSAGAGGRLATDALGTTRATTIFAAGAGNYNRETSGTQRWGDFSFTSVDPTDNMTMWTVQEYCNATDSWGVRVAKLVAPPPASPVSASPTAGSRGTSSILVTVTGTSTAGSGFFDPGAPFPNRLSASATGGITVNGVTFTDPTHVTLDLNIPLGATLGAQSITITNPDGQFATLAAGFTVTAYVPATVTSVNSTSPDGSYGNGAIIPVIVTFSSAVTVTGTPQLTLETGAADALLNLTGGSGTASLTFGYPVSPGEASPDLDYISAAALSLNGGTMKDGAALDAILTLPSPGTAGSLGANRNLVIDTVLPDTSITSGPPAATNATTAVFIFTSTKPAGAKFEVNLDGAGFVSNAGTPTITYNSLAEGAHTFQVRAIDSTSPGNVDATPASASWTVDTVAPDTTITSSPPNPDSNTTPTFNYTSTDTGSTFEFRVDGGAFTSTGTTGTVTLPALALGPHTFEVRATDPAGNVDGSPASFTWTLVAPPPAPAGGGGHHHRCGLLGLEVLLVLGIAKYRRSKRA